jgi:hypothetical protein
MTPESLPSIGSSTRTPTIHLTVRRRPKFRPYPCLITRTSKDGETHLQLRMSFQTRREMAAELRRHLSLPQD